MRGGPPLKDIPVPVRVRCRFEYLSVVHQVFFGTVCILKMEHTCFQTERLPVYFDYCNKIFGGSRKIVICRNLE